MSNCIERRECPFCHKLVMVNRVLIPVSINSRIVDQEVFECSECKKEFVLPEQYEHNKILRETIV